jgi:hypothetical protein
MKNMPHHPERPAASAQANLRRGCAKKRGR